MHCLPRTYATNRNNYYSCCIRIVPGIQQSRGGKGKVRASYTIVHKRQNIFADGVLHSLTYHFTMYIYHYTRVPRCCCMLLHAHAGAAGWCCCWCCCWWMMLLCGASACLPACTSIQRPTLSKSKSTTNKTTRVPKSLRNCTHKNTRKRRGVINGRTSQLSAFTLPQKKRTDWRDMIGRNVQRRRLLRSYDIPQVR